jgi:protein TonB
LGLNGPVSRARDLQGKDRLKSDAFCAVICSAIVPTHIMKNVLFSLALALTFVAPASAESKPEPPVPVRTVAPEYPPELRRDGVSGLVMVKCTIDEQGNVVDPQVEKSSNPAFEKPAVDALKKWKFKPAKQDGTPVAIKVSIPIKFVTET